MRPCTSDEHGLKRHNEMATAVKPTNLRELRDSGWSSKTVKREIYDNFLRMLAAGEELFPGIVGYEEHGHSRDQPGPDRPARHALSGREGAGQEPADAAA